MSKPRLPTDDFAALIEKVRELEAEVQALTLDPIVLPIYTNDDTPDDEQREPGAPWIDYEKGAICWQIADRVYCTDASVTIVDGGTVSSPFDFLFGTGDPPSTLGTQGDVYENVNNGDLWKKTSTGWDLKDNLTGPTGATGATGPAGPAGSGGAGLWRTYDVSTYSGADPTGIADSTAAFNAAATDATANGGRVWVPPAEWSVAEGSLKAGVTYEGVRGKSVIKIRTGAAYLLGCDSGSSSSFVTQMTFIGITFRGRIDTDTTFDEHRHLFNLRGVQDVQYFNCDFIGWHGDAVYLGGVDFLGSGTSPRHNQRVTLTDCFFDGLTKNNRNCISIIDGEHIIIKGCMGRRFSRGDMPGFVDVEPNPGNTFAVVRDVEVTGCRTWDHNQNFFQLNLPDSSYTVAPQDFNIHDNDADNGAANTSTRFAYLAYGRAATASSSRQNIRIHHNTCRNAYAVFEIEGGICGLEVSSNTFEDCPGAAILGYWNATTRYLRFHHNTWSNCGSNDGNVVRIEYANNVTFEHETFHNCIGNLIYFGLGESVGASSDIDYIDNEITGTGTTSISAKHASHTINAASNRRRPYRENGLTISATHFATLV